MVSPLSQIFIAACVPFGEIHPLIVLTTIVPGKKSEGKSKMLGCHQNKESYHGDNISSYNCLQVDFPLLKILPLVFCGVSRKGSKGKPLQRGTGNEKKKLCVNFKGTLP